MLHKCYQALVKWISLCADIASEAQQLRQGAQHQPASTSHLNPTHWPSHSVFCKAPSWSSVCVSPLLTHSDIAAVVRKRACDVRWEVRDSTLEFVGQLAKGCDVSRALLDACCTTPLLREALQDTESYVRASAISALAKTLAQGWQQGAALSQEEVGSDWAVSALVLSSFFSCSSKQVF